jgi:LuxR family maltose regulon positive regulatory protein
MVSEMATPLLATKLHPPRLRRGTVDRPRLTEYAAKGERPALTLVSAPAGFGKTTLLAGWIEAAADEARTAWLSLDAGDNDPAVFWTYVVAALQTARPDVGEDALTRLRAAQPMTSVVSALLNDLAPSGEVLLVLDDYHVIESGDVHDAVAFLVEHASPNVHLVIAGRADPPLPLARLRARGELRELRASELRFTADEAATYFNDSMSLDLNAADVEALESRTEGWVAALQLAALSMQGRDDTGAFVAEFAGDDRFVVDYLAEEVLDRQPDDVRSFLLETAILDRFTGDLCDAVTDGRGGKAMLERLDRANLFLVPLDDRRHWYRYHHLFAEVLRARLLDERPDLVDELHQRASAWFEAAGDHAEAITHALAGHGFERAARLIELAAPALFQARQEWTARRWLTALPDELFPDRPVLSIELVASFMVSGEVAGVEPLLDGIERWLDPDADITKAVVFDEVFFARLPAQVAVYRAALALIAGDTDATIAHGDRAVELAEPTDHLRRGSAAGLMGLAAWTKGDLDAATRYHTNAIEALTAAGHISDVLGCTIALADMRMAQGRLGDAERACESALQLAQEHGAVRGRADMHVALSEVLLERNDLERARHHLDASARLGDGAALPQHAYRSRVATARLRQAEGDLAAALELLDEAERVYNTDLSPPVRPVTAVKARAQLAGADLPAARRWATASGLSPDDELNYVQEYEHVTLARVLLADRATDDAARLLERLLAAAEVGARSGAVIEILTLLSLAQDAAGDRRTATTTLADALTRAAPEGYVRVFADQLPALEPILRATRRPDAARDLVRDILAAGGSPADRAETSPHGLVDPLSDRELEVLRLLRGELSGPDIARELHVSLNTLRTHTKNIYTKLGVNNRREAVRRAAELGL